jgi:hypothetical protein
MEPYQPRNGYFKKCNENFQRQDPGMECWWYCTGALETGNVGTMLRPVAEKKDG